jgi:general secretion pathway protein A
LIENSQLLWNRQELIPVGVESYKSLLKQLVQWYLPMYTKYFGFSEKPFTLTPNPRFIYLSSNHKEAFAHLLYGINNHYGFIELIGEVGTGKTTVLRTLLGQLQEENYTTALIFNPCLTGVELLRSICIEFGLDAHSQFANDLLAVFNSFLLAENAAGRTVVLVIDESQNLLPEVLEQIRLVSNLETEDDKLIQIVLAGQPELALLLERPELRQLKQRIAVSYRLRAMNVTETKEYIQHRMVIAGETGGVSFSGFALRWIYLYTRGVPRLINILCDRCLLIAYGDEQRRVTAFTVTRAIREILDIRSRPRVSFTLAAILVAVVITIAFLLSGSTMFARFGKTTQSVASPVSLPLTPVVGSEVTIRGSNTPSLSALQQEVISYDMDDFHLQAFNTLAEVWGVSQLNVFSGELSVPGMFARLAQKRNLRLTMYKGTLADVIKFNVPFLALTTVGSATQKYAIAVTSLTQNSAAISPTLFDQETIPLKDLAALSSGTFYLVWQNFGQIPENLTKGTRRFEIRSLQTLLHTAGFYSGSVDGLYSSDTIAAIDKFQDTYKINRNDAVGEQTLAALTQFYNNRKVPRLVNSKGGTR